MKAGRGRHHLRISIAAVAIAFAAHLGTPAGGFAAEINWVGCGIVRGAFMDAIAKAYEKKTGVAMKLSGGGATKGIRAPSAGSADMGGTCRHVLVDDNGQAVSEEKDATLHKVAWDALVAITHPSNPVADISLDNLKKIYDGGITNWSALGGPDAKIVLVTREGTTSGVGYTFRLLAFNDGAYDFKGRSFKVKDTGPLEDKIETTPFSLGIDGVSSAKKRKVKILSLDGVKPTKENIASGKFPFYRPVYIATNRQAAPEVKTAMDFILSPEGQAIISKEGTVNLAEGAALDGRWEAKSKAFKH